jgi:hypothetical protein
MPKGVSRLFRLLPVIMLAACVLATSGTAVSAEEEEPIAYVGHGAFFDRTGKELVPTQAFVNKSQDWYQKKLLAALSAKKKAEFGKIEKQLHEEVKAQGQTRLVVRQRLLEWLIANAQEVKPDHRTIGKLNALKFALHWKLPESDKLDLLQTREVFTLDSALEEKLNLPDSDIQFLAATINLGQNYIDECAAAGVPIPPTIGVLDPAGVAGWKSQGFIPNQFIVRTPAEVRTFQSSSPPGMCIALPRYTDSTKTTVMLDGVICQGQQTAKVCFWDNQMNRQGFQFPSGTQVPIGVPNIGINPAGQYQAGGFELLGGSGGVCSDCHAGENPYIIHPKADLSPTVKMEDLNRPPQNLPTFAVTRYDPIVPADWPQNQLSQSPPLVPSVCSGCHTAGGIGGRFPHLSSELGGYCGSVLKRAIGMDPSIPPTMPPSSPGSEKDNPEVIALVNWCNTSASAGPSDRGDPHLTTTNGINYDFQSAGEFTALRNSDSRFELQTRQTPVSTINVPLPNAYTGLASCVSLNTAAAIRLGKHRVTYGPGRGGLVTREKLELRIDGALVNLAGHLDLGNGNSIARASTGGGLDIRSSDGTHVLITPSFWTSQGYWYLDVEVLNTPAREGTMGHIPTGDWLPLAPNGSSFGPAPASLGDRYKLLNKKFADAWRVTTKSSLFDYPPGTSTVDFTDRNWPPESGKPCNAVTPPLPPVKPMPVERAQTLCKVIKDKTARDNCVFDVATTGDPAWVKSYQNTLSLRQKAIASGPP